VSARRPDLTGLDDVALINGREPPEHAPELAEYLFDAAGIASQERPPAGPGQAGH
jgi:hypothetical protein